MKYRIHMIYLIVYLNGCARSISTVKCKIWVFPMLMYTRDNAVLHQTIDTVMSIIMTGPEYYTSHYSGVIMDAAASQITSLTTVNSTVYSSANQRKHQSTTLLAFVWGIHRWPVNSPHKWPVTRKMFPFDDVFMHKVNAMLSGSCII